MFNLRWVRAFRLHRKMCLRKTNISVNKWSNISSYKNKASRYFPPNFTHNVFCILCNIQRAQCVSVRIYHE